ncbi:cancer-related nucleoside-triphosphatase homolog isoform X2 [Pseudomyrmex gracilis]|uniref:cancer-related nucleoside-triphosphatase homolog isoform X2 n=1 Tax=Pseudomyrmex gracilis TaxID=219809 RepID=UPI000994ED8C|nr:cancer-related nucleoside-triphosphatase homolog isoform X2 [Pseudomyrmex gracilis]
MEAGAVSRPLCVLLTGPPGIGKTTVCKKVASTLEKKGVRFDGFYTEEVRNQSGSRIGFDVVRVADPERRSSLSRLKNLTEIQKVSKYQVGNYTVFLDNFEAVALPSLDSDTDILLIDEIGKMKLFSKDFKKKVTDIIFGSSAKKVSVIGTVPQAHKVPRQHAALFERMLADDRIKILNVSHGNRNDLPDEIVRCLS